MKQTHRFRNFLLTLAWMGVGYAVFRYLSQCSEEACVKPQSQPEPEGPPKESNPEPIQSMSPEEVAADEAEVVALAEHIEEKTAAELDALIAESAVEPAEVIEVPPPVEEVPVEEAPIEPPTISEQDNDEDEEDEDLATALSRGKNAKEKDDDEEDSSVESDLEASTYEDPEALEISTPRWIHPADGGTCALTHPIKARFSTGRYHLPEDDGYDKVHADCCYENSADAEADGFTHSPR